MLPDLAYQSISSHYGRLVSLSLPCPNISFAKFLASEYGNSRFFWESATDDFAVAGIGTAVEISDWTTERFDKVHYHIDELFTDATIETDDPIATPRVFGGFSFREDFVPDNTWADFAPALFILPHYQLTRQADKTFLTLNAHIPYGENPHDLFTELREALRAKIDQLVQRPDTTDQPTNSLLHIDYPMDQSSWATMIANATQRMKNGELKKAVLSRVAEIRFSEEVNVDNALAYLAGAYPQTYRFLFEPRPQVAFFGATPELLAEVQGNQLKTMALAGSIKRGKSIEEDNLLGAQLLHDPKERYEHQLVVDMLRTRLEPIVEHLHVDETSLLKLSNIQHLYTPVNGSLAHADGILAMIQQLHPTPALGGEPRDIAMKLISEAEPIPRGWFGAPIGWIDSRLNGQFGVAIRSAIAQQKRVWLYAGAGIVSDSIPEKEWDETALKFRPMLNALGLNQATL